MPNLLERAKKFGFAFLPQSETMQPAMARELI
jgi:hypothetical protein